MKSSIFLFFSFIIYLQFFAFINCKKFSTKEKEKIKSTNKTKEEKIKSANETLEDTSEKKEGEDGHMMTDEEFEQKLKEILKEKRIKKNMKITKDKLKEIFEAMYEKDFELPDLPKDTKEEKIDLDPKEESKRFLNEMFSKLARSLDYDDEITQDQIKEYISPKRVQVVVGEIVESLIGMMGDL